MKEAKLNSEIKTMRIKDSGKTKEEALGKIFASFRRKVQTEITGVIVKLEPLETYLLDIKEEKKNRKIFGTFYAKRKNYISHRNGNRI